MTISDLAQKAANNFQAQGLVTDDDIDVFKYHFEFVISMGLVISVVLFMAILTHTLLASIVYLSVFFLFRSACGGYHATSYGRCFITSILCYTIFVILIKSIPDGLYTMEICMGVGILANLLILLLAPVAHPNKPFSDYEKIQYRVKSVVYLCLLDLGIIATLILAKPYAYLALAAVLGAVQSALAVTIVYIFRWREGLS